MDEPLEFEELWALERVGNPGCLVRPIDTNTHEDQGALVYFSCDAAESAAEYQSGYYEVNCTPRRIVTGEPPNQERPTMITLSEFLNTIPFPDNAYKSALVAIREAKRLEALDAPRVKAERKPIVDDEGDGLYVIWSNEKCIDWASDRGVAKDFADKLSQETGQPHTVCQVMAPESGECPTVPVMTFTPAPERPHEWVVYQGKCEYDCHWFAITARGDKYWGASPTHTECQRFPTSAEAQTYIDTEKIADAYPWPVPKLTS